MADDIEIRIPGLRLAAAAWGPADAPPVLLLHGWLDNAASFARLAPLLPGLRLVALDLPGHGRSEHRPAPNGYHFIELVPAMFAAADALGWTRFALVGHSLGAAAATLMAGTVPERVSRLVLLEGIGPLTIPPEDAPDQLRQALADRARPVSEPPVLPDLDAAVARILARNPGRSPAAAQLLAERGTAPVPGGGVRFAHDRRLRWRSLVRLTEDQVLAFLRRIECPTLVVRATQGWPADPAQARARLQSIRQARLVSVPGGHHVHLEDPESIAGDVGRFLRGEPELGL